MNLEETADFISEGLPAYQYQANLEFLKRIHKCLKDGGTWIYPGRGLILTKTDDGFELMIDERTS